MPENVSGAKRVAAGKRQRAKKRKKWRGICLFYPKLIGAVCGVCAAGALIYAGVSALDKAGVSADGILSSKPTLTVWYTEEKLEDYLSAMALEYQE